MQILVRATLKYQPPRGFPVVQAKTRAPLREVGGGDSESKMLTSQVAEGEAPLGARNAAPHSP